MPDLDQLGTCDTCDAYYPLYERGPRCGDCGDCSQCCQHQVDEYLVYASEQDGATDSVTDIESAVMSLVLASRVREIADDGAILPPELECE